MKRICIHTKDVEALTGYSNSTARRLLNKIREQLQKPQLAPITIQEFCDYTKIQKEEIEKLIK